MNDEIEQPPRLSDYLRTRRAAILEAWETAAGRQGPAQELKRRELRDHIPELLDAIIERAAQGQAAAAGAKETAYAHAHALQRLQLSFPLEAVTREYARLREIILRELSPLIGEPAADQLIIINEALDEAIVEAVRAYSEGHSARLGEERASLEASELRFRRLFHADVIGMLEWHAPGPIIAANDTFLRMVGYSREDLEAGRLNFRRLTPPEYQRATDGAVHSLKTTGALPPFEKQYLRKDGSRVDILLSGAALDPANTHGIGLALDISARKRLEAEHAERSGFERQLIGIVGHDLRSPLSAINLAAALLLRRKDLDPAIVRGLTQILSAAERSQRMTRDLLDLTRARLGGGIPIEPQPSDLHGIVRQAVDELQASHADRPITVERQGDGAGEWDPDRLAQVVCNLVINALSYSPPGTPVSVRSSGEGARGVMIEVRNQGDPIPPEAQRHVFEPLRSAGESSKSRLGLGLFIVQHIVSAHGGKVELESDETGTLFRVTLPRHFGSAPVGSTSVERPAGKSG